MNKKMLSLVIILLALTLTGCTSGNTEKITELNSRISKLEGDSEQIQTLNIKLEELKVTQTQLLDKIALLEAELAPVREVKFMYGPQGDIGPQGIQGLPGPQGLPGRNGQDAPSSIRISDIESNISDLEGDFYNLEAV